ncbi:MAG: hypothetical protein HY329_01485 [Chloroflexi bacterium]|nr:hypothetical protein [Chloroflexota bacterium]
MEVTTTERRYAIDLDWYERRGRSFRAMAETRYCGACRGKIGSSATEQQPTIDPETGRAVFDDREQAFGDDPFAVIRQCCSLSRDYITADTPVLEAVFRVFLANGNQPSTLKSVQEQLEQWIPLYSRPHGYAVPFLERMLASDTLYGVRPVEASVEQGIGA